jgi:hypothetical protein
MDSTADLLQFLAERIMALEAENERLQRIINILNINKNG